MTGINQPVPRTFVPGETEAGAFYNATRDALNALLGPPHFRGSITSATTLAINTNIAYPSIEDNYSTWNSSSNYWVVPPTWSGLYIAYVQFKWGTGPGSAPSCKIFGGASNATLKKQSPNGASTASFNGIQLSGGVRCNAGDQISVQLTGAGFTTQSDGANVDNNFFEFYFYSV